jgi:hypothetical protein
MKPHRLLLVMFGLLASLICEAAQPWPLPASQPAAQPSLSKSPEGQLNLSWIERTDSGHRLQFARYHQGRWTATQTIAQGNDWFVNWADFPSTSATADGTLWAHNLVKRGKGSYAYDVVLYRSSDGGKHWSKPMTVHDDRTESEHGFATLWPWSKNEIAIAWLDGRHTATGNDHSQHDAHSATKKADMNKAMTLRAATFNRQGRKTREWLLDSSTCDCCQTDSSLTTQGPVVIYRNRTADEIRDIQIMRFVAGRWLAPQAVAPDNWTMPACPVNGPAIATQGQSLWAAWYTAAGGVPALRMAYSGNSGERFTHDATLRRGASVQGRVDLQADQKGAWLLWTEETEQQSLWLQPIDRRLQARAPAARLATLQGRGRATGFARMQLADGRAYIVWTDVVAGKPVLRGAIAAP